MKLREDADRLTGGLFSEEEEEQITAPSVPVAASDQGLSDLVRSGILALQLLPKNSSACLIVITDG